MSQTFSNLQKLHLKIRIYQFLGVFFAAIGIYLFAMQYIHNFGGHFFMLLKDPVVLAVLLLPFVPALVFSKMANHLRERYTEQVRQHNSNIKQLSGK